MPSFLALGECMIEMADLGDGLYRRGFAGDTFNTTWYARRLLPGDWTVGYGSCIGADGASDQMRAFMEAGGIETSALRVVPGRSVGLYMISLAGGERSFSYWRGQSAARTLADDPAWLESILAGRDVIYFSGITLAILAPDARKAFCRAVAQVRAGGALVAFDTNLRPQLWEDRDAMQAGMLAGASVADVVLPSFDEEEGLFGDATPSDTIARYAGCGAGCVAVKNGPGEVTLSDADGTRTLPVATGITPVDTTAAGDSFAAAFVAGLATGASAERAANAAMALAAQVIQHKGALVPQVFEGGST